MHATSLEAFANGSEGESVDAQKRRVDIFLEQNCYLLGACGVTQLPRKQEEVTRLASALAWSLK